MGVVGVGIGGEGGLHDGLVLYVCGVGGRFWGSRWELWGLRRLGNVVIVVRLVN